MIFVTAKGSGKGNRAISNAPSSSAVDFASSDAFDDYEYEYSGTPTLPACATINKSEKHADTPGVTVATPRLALTAGSDRADVQGGNSRAAVAHCQPSPPNSSGSSSRSAESYLSRGSSGAWLSTTPPSTLGSAVGAAVHHVPKSVVRKESSTKRYFTTAREEASENGELGALSSSDVISDKVHGINTNTQYRRAKSSSTPHGVESPMEGQDAQSLEEPQDTGALIEEDDDSLMEEDDDSLMEEDDESLMEEEDEFPFGPRNDFGIYDSDSSTDGQSLGEADDYTNGQSSGEADGYTNGQSFGEADNYTYGQSFGEADELTARAINKSFRYCSVDSLVSLCRETWPDLDTDKLELEGDFGGAFNQVYGVAHLASPSSLQAVGQRYIIRVPKPNNYSPYHVDFAVKNSDFARRTLTGRVPVPEVLKWDPTTQNPIHQPYSVHLRVDGERLDEAYPQFSHQEKVKFAAYCGDFYSGYVMGPEYPIPGRINPTSADALAGKPRILRFNPKRRPESAITLTDQCEPALACEPHEHLIKHLQWLNLPGNDQIKRSRQQRGQLIKVLTELTEQDKFRNMPNILCHFDFEPRNIIVQKDKETSEFRITGIVDWDDAAIAPRVAACKPPFWLWRLRHNIPHFEDKEHEYGQGSEDMTEQEHEIMRAFQENVCSEFLEMAFDPEYELMRRCIIASIKGNESTRQWNYCAKLLKDYSEYDPVGAAESRQSGKETCDSQGQAATENIASRCLSEFGGDSSERATSNAL